MYFLILMLKFKKFWCLVIMHKSKNFLIKKFTKYDWSEMSLFGTNIGIERYEIDVKDLTFKIL